MAGGRAGACSPPLRAGIPAHRRPIFGSWLFRGVTPSLQLAGALTTREFRALATSAVREAGEDVTNFGTARAGGRRRLFSTPACRARSSRRRYDCPVDETYILESAKLAAVAAAPRMPPPCRSAGAGLAPRGRSPPRSGPPTSDARLHPAGAPQPGSPLGPWGGHDDRASAHPGMGAGSRSSGWARQPRGRGHRGGVLPHVRFAARRGPDRP